MVPTLPLTAQRYINIGLNTHNLIFCGQCAQRYSMFVCVKNVNSGILGECVGAECVGFLTNCMYKGEYE